MPAEERAQAHLKVADLRQTPAWIAAHPEQWQARVTRSLASVRDDRDEVGARQQLEARKYHDTFARLPRIQVPVLLAGGEYDGIAPVANMQRLHEQIPDSSLQIFQGGHMFLMQDKLAYPAIVEWLQTHI